MKIAVLDITSRNAVLYNPSLCNSLSKIESDVTLLSPKIGVKDVSFKHNKLLNLIPDSWVSKTTRTKRVFRAIEVIINYLIVWFYLLMKRPDVLHIQWLPFLEFSSIELKILKWYHLSCKNTRLFLTVHNVFPHDMPIEKREGYINRFIQLDSCLSGYFVHLYSNKEDLIRNYNIKSRKIHVAYHGIYNPVGYKPVIHHEPDGKLHIIMYGYQNKYKGADILVNAIKLLPKEYLHKVEVVILGKTSNDLLHLVTKDLESINIHWNPTFVSDEELYDAIGISDLIILPYRAISQSGVLLLALSYRKPIITSDLPSFKETLKGYKQDWFFKSEDSQSLSDLIKRYVDKDIDIQEQVKVIETLNELYSWDETARKTLEAYYN